MPMHEYLCNKCNLKFTKIIKFSDNSNFQNCEKCGSDDTTKIPSFSGNFSLKGKGWYNKGGYGGR